MCVVYEWGAPVAQLVSLRGAYISEVEGSSPSGRIFICFFTEQMKHRDVIYLLEKSLQNIHTKWWMHIL